MRQFIALCFFLSATSAEKLTCIRVLQTFLHFLEYLLWKVCFFALQIIQVKCYQIGELIKRLHMLRSLYVWDTLRLIWYVCCAGLTSWLNAETSSPRPFHGPGSSHTCLSSKSTTHASTAPASFARYRVSIIGTFPFCSWVLIRTFLW